MGKDHAHCSHHTCSHDTDIKKITRVLFIILIFMAIELWGHYKTHSLSLLADALHLLVDLSGFIVSIITLKISKRHENSKMTFGYQRAEILGALLSIVLIWAAIGYLAVESFHKYMHPTEIDGFTFFGISVMGFFVNLLCVYVLHHEEYSHDMRNKNLNMRATIVHVVGDIVQSVGVIIASGIIYFWPKLVIADVFCTLFFAILVLCTTIYILRDAIFILAEGAPAQIDQNKIREKMLSFGSVIKINTMRVWSVSVNQHAIMLNVLADRLSISEYETLMLNITNYLKKELEIAHVSVQIDTPRTNQNHSGLVVGGVNVNSEQIVHAL
ncbi:solute carrier family 30 (zinc transporter), member 2 [Enteropsectra breve]|nr:solute carrier family 30 (zinc transporter), member 2 [Enteropsectra breve]